MRYLVTGAAGAIGSACVSKLLAAGASQVFGLDSRAFDGPHSARLMAHSSFTPVQTHHSELSDEACLRDALMAEASGGGPPALSEPLDGLICVQGGNPPGLDNTNYSAPGETATGVFAKQFDFNLLSTVAAVNACMPQIVAGRGSIVLSSSVNGLTGIGEVPYSCAKAALHPLAMNLAVHYGPQGVNANVVAIGTVASPNIWGSALEKDPAVLEKIGSRNPRRKVGTPEEAADVLVFLASPQAALINGAVIVADGGWTIAAGTSTDNASWFD